jgi:hypothetical protein
MSVMITLLALVLAVDAGANIPVPAPVPSAALREAKAVVADYARAIGDEKNWQKHKTVRVKREVTVKAMHFTSSEETRMARGGKVFSSSEMPGMGTFQRGSDGHKAWSKDPIGGLRLLKGGEAEDVRIAATWNSEWHLGDVYAQAFSVAPPVAPPAGATWECVEFHKVKGAPTTICFDSKTHLRVLEKGVQASQGGQVPYVTRFSDWRPVQGVLVWHHEDVTVGPVTMESQVMQIVFDEPIPATLFKLPRK